MCDGGIERRFIGYRRNISIIKRAAGVMLISAGTRDGRGSAAEGKGSDGRGTITELCIALIQSSGYRAAATALPRRHIITLLIAINILPILIIVVPRKARQ